MTTRFDPFRRVDCRRGAPMGRAGDDPATYDGVSKLYARDCGGDGYYDRGGAYWGHGEVCAVWTYGGKWCAYIQTHLPAHAINLVRAAANAATKVGD